MNLDALSIQLGYNLYAVTANTDGLTQEESLITPEAGGNCLNWVVGHIVASRHHMLTLLGAKGIWSEEQIARFDRGSPPVTGPEDAESLSNMRRVFAVCQKRALAGLAEVSDETLSAPAPFSPLGNPDETVFSLLAGLVFHEAYHAGQTSLLRRAAGKDPAIS